MALLNLSKYSYNGYTSKVESTIKTIDAVNRSGEDFIVVGGQQGKRKIESGDILAIGAIPRNCLVTDIRIIYEEAFHADTTFDFGFVGDFPDDNLTVIKSGIVAAIANGTQYIPVGNSGVVDPDGTAVPSAESDYRGSLWNGDKRPLMLAIRVNNATVTELIDGKCKMLVSFIRFGEEDIVRGEPIRW